MTADTAAVFLGKKVLITGGLGVIGSTIALKLVESGAQVTLVDACIGDRRTLRISGNSAMSLTGGRLPTLRPGYNEPMSITACIDHGIGSF